ncbi:MAG: radical SAM protein [Candidatus Marinimicrobia bacterium]|nr:radical SAM protein [Candidatus Neomarinimicrobiota bacterium]
MPELLTLPENVTEFQVDPNCMSIRRRNFSNEITFHMPGLKTHRTSEIEGSLTEFVSLSVTGSACALSCEHCKTEVLKGMVDLTAEGGSLYDTCQRLAEKGARGVLVSGGSDLKGRVPLLQHVPDLIRIRKELGLIIRLHVGLPDEETCAAISEIGIDGAMLDIIGDQETISDVYHLSATPDDYGMALENLQRYNVPTIPHIIIGHYFGKMKGEWNALQMIKNNPPKILVLVILMPLTGTPMANVLPPSMDEIGLFFQTARIALPETPVMLGCAKPIGEMKLGVDKLALETGLNGIAYPADGIVGQSEQLGLKPNIVNACCGVTW